MGCNSSKVHSAAAAAVSVSAEEAAKTEVKMLKTLHSAKHLPCQWEEALAEEMVRTLAKTSQPIQLQPLDVRRFAEKVCYQHNMARTESMVERAIRRSLQINKALQDAGYRFFRVMVETSMSGSMSGAVLGQLIARKVEEVGHDVLADSVCKFTKPAAGKAHAWQADEDDDDDDDDDYDEVTELTDDDLGL